MPSRSLLDNRASVTLDELESLLEAAEREAVEMNANHDRLQVGACIPYYRTRARALGWRGRWTGLCRAPGRFGMAGRGQVEGFLGMGSALRWGAALVWWWWSLRSGLAVPCAHAVLWAMGQAVAFHHVPYQSNMYPCKPGGLY